MRFSMLCLAALLVASCATKPTSEAAAPENLILTEDTAAGLKEYQGKVGSIGHGYFAVAVDGSGWWYWSCKTTSCIGNRAAYKADALRDCRANNDGIDCVILAQDQDIVLKYRTYPVPLPPMTDQPPASSQPQTAASRPPALPADQLAKKGHPGWAVDQLHGCWVWNQRPEKHEVATWTGACAPDGTATGEGVLEWKDYARYIGSMKNGREDGPGKMVNAYGESYEGGHKDGEHDGQGTYVWSDGARYQGGYKNGYANGTGVFTFRNETYSGEWKNGCFNDGKKKYRILNNNIPGCTL